MRGLYDKKPGLSLTPRQLQQVVHRLRLYAKENLTDEEHDLVKAVEDIQTIGGNDRQIKEGRRHYFGGKSSDEDASKRTIKVIAFCDECESWLHEISPWLQDRPLGFLFSYIGYALSFSKRTNQDHNDNGISNWFMNLFLATCQAVLTDKGQVWGFLEFVVCYCVSGEEVPVAEALVTLLTEAWYKKGTGLGVHPPGEAGLEADFKNVKWEEYVRLEDAWIAFREKETPYRENILKELQRVKEYPAEWERRFDAAKAKSNAETSAMLAEVQEREENLLRKKNQSRRRHIARLWMIWGLHLQIIDLFGTTRPRSKNRSRDTSSIIGQWKSWASRKEQTGHLSPRSESPVSDDTHMEDELLGT
jgi:hypothetical protein